MPDKNGTSNSTATTLSQALLKFEKEVIMKLHYTKAGTDKLIANKLVLLNDSVKNKVCTCAADTPDITYYVNEEGVSTPGTLSPTDSSVSDAALYFVPIRDEEILKRDPNIRYVKYAVTNKQWEKLGYTDFNGKDISVTDTDLYEMVTEHESI